MILKKEFYFVRHGQTDHNALENEDKGDHPHDIPLNQIGKQQAENIKPLIARLPIKTVCASPMKRAQETKNIISSSLIASHHEIEELGECSAKIWKEMRRLGMYSPFPSDGEAKDFMERVKIGLNRSLALPGPSLIVAHGGIHWAACCLLGIVDHYWAIDNCGVVHFSIHGIDKWIAKKLA